jgi:ribonuclease Z
MKIELVVVGGRTLDTEPSFLISIDGVSYLFNVPDGTQRLFMQNRRKLLHIKQIFFTSHHPESVGGIFGTMMTLSHSATIKFGITSDARTQQIITESSTFLSAPELLPPFTPDYADDKLTVVAIPLTQTIAYRLQFRDYPGTFIPGNAKKLGVPVGPLFRKLASGESVTLEDGRVIKSEDVLTPATPGDVILIVDCKSAEDIALLANIDLPSVGFFIHFTCPTILNTEAYLSLFPYDGRKHVCFLQSGRISYGAIAEVYSKLTGSSICSGADGTPPPNFVDGYSGLTYQFLPPNQPHFTNPLKMKPSPQSEVELPVFSTFAVTILGTGTPMPQRMRNTTGILVHMASGFVVLDAGEDFIGQVRRKYGLRNTEFILANLKMIWISHIHVDHCFGLYQLLYERRKVTDCVIPLIMNEELITDFRVKESLFEDGFFKVEFLKIEANVRKGDGFSLKSVPVIHCPSSHGCLVTIDEKWKLAFSGDRCVQDGFVEAIESCDLLIHEATFNDEMAKAAHENGHSTISEAIETGVKLSSRWTILTHFSPRYTGVVLRAGSPNVLFAFDYLSFTFDDEAMQVARELGNRFFTAIDAEGDGGE